MFVYSKYSPISALKTFRRMGYTRNFRKQKICKCIGLILDISMYQPFKQYFLSLDTLRGVRFTAIEVLTRNTLTGVPGADTAVSWSQGELVLCNTAGAVLLTMPLAALVKLNNKIFQTDIVFDPFTSYVIFTAVSETNTNVQINFYQ